MSQKVTVCLMRQVQFDRDKAKLLLNSYGCATGLPFLLMDDQGHILENYKTESNLVEFLGLDQKKLVESHLYGVNQASIYGGSYVYFGPYGFVYFTTPVMNKNGILGAFVVGPLLMTMADEYLYQNLLKSANKSSIDLPLLKYELEKINVVTPKRVKALADLLKVAVHYVSPDIYDQFEEDQRNLQQKSEIASYMSHLKTMGGDTIEGIAYPIEKEKELLNLISIGDQEGSNKVLNEILAHIYIGYGMNLDMLKSRVLELVVLLSRAALEGGAQAEEIFGLNYSYLNEIHSYKTVEQLTDWLVRICQRFTTTIFRFGEAKHQDAIYKAMDYIKQNYMYKITLEEVAEYVYFSSSYLSRIFKNETGITFNKYLNKVRITASKQFLKDKNMSLADIADEVGYHDQSHFSKMFKSIVGTSPKRYSETLK